MSNPDFDFDDKDKFDQGVTLVKDGTVLIGYRVGDDYISLPEPDHEPSGDYRKLKKWLDAGGTPTSDKTALKLTKKGSVDAEFQKRLKTPITTSIGIVLPPEQDQLLRLKFAYDMAEFMSVSETQIKDVDGQVVTITLTDLKDLIIELYNAYMGLEQHLADVKQRVEDEEDDDARENIDWDD